VWRGQRTWNGVAILGRNFVPELVRDRLPGDPEGKQARYIEAAIHGVLVGCIYLPNGNPQGEALLRAATVQGLEGIVSKVAYFALRVRRHRCLDQGQGRGLY
jgi:exonuclease III